MSILSKALSIFKPAEPIAPQYKNEEEMRSQYGYWRLRQLYSTFVGYGVFYFVRKNISIAIPLLENSLGISKAAIGMIVSISDVVYGVSKFVNGFFGDRCNARYFMAVGLLLSALANFMFGMSSAVAVLLAAWVLNGWFQGMGSPPCSRVICHWFSSKERGTYWSIWNTSHQIGLSLILIMGGYLGEYFGWRYVFCVPAAIAALTSLFLLERMRDTPASLGLPDPEVYTKEKPFVPVEEQKKAEAVASETEANADNTKVAEEKQSGKEFFRFLCRHVFNNPYIWAVCFANFFIYILRYGFVTWGPSYLNARGVTLSHAGITMACFEIAGIAGSLLAGWMTDRFFKGKRAPVCAYYTIASLISIFVFWKLPVGSSVLVYSLMFIVTGFFIYGPQLLVAIMATDFATKKAAATAVGMTGLFGYLSSIVSGWGMGRILDAYGWDVAFQMLLACAFLSILPFIFAWSAKPNDLEKLEAEDREEAKES